MTRDTRNTVEVPTRQQHTRHHEDYPQSYRPQTSHRIDYSQSTSGLSHCPSRQLDRCSFTVESCEATALSYRDESYPSSPPAFLAHQVSASAITRARVPTANVGLYLRRTRPHQGQARMGATDAHLRCYGRHQLVLYPNSCTEQNRLTDSSLHDSAWAAEQIYFMNYMISIGIPKSTISLVWLAGPITGLVGQPLFGAMSDSCKSSWGMTLPFEPWRNLILTGQAGGDPSSSTAASSQPSGCS